MDEEEGKLQLRDCLVSDLCLRRTRDDCTMAHDSTMDGTAAATPATPFAPSLFPSVLSLQTEYSQSTPYHHAVIHRQLDWHDLARSALRPP